MVFLNEWLPNPTGSDTKGEFIELWNGGSSPVNLNGWILQADGKKKFRLFGTIKADGYLLLPRSETKLSLKNTDGKLVLFDAAGRLADQPAFEGSAPEGKSFNRVSYDSYDGSSIYNTIQQFAWGAPTQRDLVREPFIMPSSGLGRRKEEYLLLFVAYHDIFSGVCFLLARVGFPLTPSIFGTLVISAPYRRETHPSLREISGGTHRRSRSSARATRVRGQGPF